MPFFERPRRDPEDEEDDQFESDFLDPRSTYLGGVVPLELLLARSDDAAVAIRGLVAYPDGFEFTLKSWVRKVPRRRRGRLHRPMLVHPMDVEDDEELPEEFLRFGLEFPDGASITNLQEPHWRVSPDATEPAHGLESRSGGGSDTEYEQEWWAWPLPTPGTLWFVCEWPAYGIAETRVSIDARTVIDAATRSIPIWPDLADGVSHRRWSVGFQQLRAESESDPED